MNAILSDLINDKFQRLPAARNLEHQRLIKIHMLFGQFDVIDNQIDVVILVLSAGMPQANADWTFTLGALGFRKVKFVVIAPAPPLKSR